MQAELATSPLTTTPSMLTIGDMQQFTVILPSLAEIYNGKYLYGWTALDQHYLHPKDAKSPQRSTKLRLGARVIQKELAIVPSTTTQPVLTLVQAMSGSGLAPSP
ncbi:hypothetical protein EV702DRAFT_1045306 [Suillus placidus]|uniref:Uncharacterized protein n=1 Tax=Suillus placidus TaxID=48579 RepID=A0A9P6ZVK0_9AGAM|nr:hypothetical protein EV702DRAFT_1045306 [Suillus placidus]